MRKLLWMVVIVGYVCCFFVGCKAITETYDSYERCKRDPVCYEKMRSGESLSAAIASSAAAAIPQTAAASTVIGSSVGQLVSILIGVWLGRKIRKDDK